METQNATIDRANGHYTIITADSHAGASHAGYREYLDPNYVEDFDAWRAKYRNPYRDLGDNRRLRNWDEDLRNEQQLSDGVVGEVLFPNTVPPFFPTFVLHAQSPKPEDYEHRLAGIHAHNRWLVDFCGVHPERRAGIGQIFLNDVDDAIEDVKFIKEHGLRGGLLLPNNPPDVTWVKPLYDPAFDRLWDVIQDLDVPVNSHSGSGNPNYGDYPFALLFYVNEAVFYTQRPLVQLILGGVFERFPRLKFVMTETGGAWVPPMLGQLDHVIEMARGPAMTELRFPEGAKLKRLASEYFAQNVWLGVSQPRQADAAARKSLPPDRFMWGSDYPHDEGTHPYTREHLRQIFAGASPDEMQRILGENVAKLYDFDLAKLAPMAAKYGPTVEELAEPLNKLPANPNAALLNGATTAV